MTDAIMNTYGRIDVAFERGDGAWLIDDQDNRYLDALSGLGVCALGHAHPALARTIAEQAGRLMHTSNLYRVPLQEKLAARLTGMAEMDNVFFANSGAEANECAIKIARLFGRGKGIDNPTIVVTDNSFHGRTLATLTATGSRKVQAGFEPLVNGFVRAPYNDVDAIKKIAQNNSNVCAVMVEPVQGEGGIRVPDDTYLEELRAICDEKDWFLILDEVQSGNGRTGAWFAYQHTAVRPDIVTTAKGLGNGFPIGACLAKGKAASTFNPGNHGSTFGGNPLACATALTVIDTIESEGLVQRAGELGDRMLRRFRERLGRLNCVKDIRGKGLMIGIELDSPCTDMVKKAQDRGLLINVTTEKVIRLLPPLIISDDEADQICDTVCSLVEEC